MRRALFHPSTCTTQTFISYLQVHERNLDTDILLALLKQSLPAYPHLRVVLMSATLDADRFAGYWKGHTPRIHIPGRTFPVKDYMLEDVLTLTKYIPPKPKKGRSTASSFSNEWDDEAETEEGEPINEEETVQGHQVADLVKRVDESSINYDLLAQLVRHLVLEKNPADDGSILVFLPGAPEIDRALEAVKKVTRDAPVLLLPLHGGLHPKDQNRVFKPAGIGLHKIVLSTNVAET
jgi:ATP-dependent RNA helicase DHX57